MCHRSRLYRIVDYCKKNSNHFFPAYISCEHLSHSSNILILNRKTSKRNFWDCNTNQSIYSTKYFEPQNWTSVNAVPQIKSSFLGVSREKCNGFFQVKKTKWLVVN